MEAVAQEQAYLDQMQRQIQAQAKLKEEFEQKRAQMQFSAAAAVTISDDKPVMDRVRRRAVEVSRQPAPEIDRSQIADRLQRRETEALPSQFPFEHFAFLLIFLGGTVALWQQQIKSNHLQMKIDKLEVTRLPVTFPINGLDESEPVYKPIKKKRANDPAAMKTVMRIPWKRAPEDPSWLTKAHAGRKMDAIEVEEWYRHLHNRNHEALLKDN